MRTYLLSLWLLSVGCSASMGQSFTNIRILPLGEPADTLYKAGYYRKALPYAREALAALEGRPIVDTAIFAKTMYRLGEVEYLAGDYEGAFPHLQGAFSLYYTRFGMTDDTCVAMCRALSLALVRSIRWEEADSLLSVVIPEAECNGGVSAFSKIALHWCLGNVYHNQRKYEQARQIYENCKAGWEALNAKKTEEYCFMLYALSALYDQLDYDEASFKTDQAGLEIHRQIYGRGHPTAYFLNGLAVSNRRLGNWNVSIEYFEELTAALREKLGEDAWWLGLVCYNYGNLSIEIGDYDKARHLHEQAFRIMLNAHGKKHSDYPMLLSALGRVAFLQKDYETADSLYRESLRARIEILGKKHPYYPAGLTDLATVCIAQERPVDAFDLLQEALAAQIEVEGPRHSSVAMTLRQMALCKLFEGNYLEADSLMQRSSDLCFSIFDAASLQSARQNDFRMLTGVCVGSNLKNVEKWAREGHAYWKKTAQHALGYATAHQLESILNSISFHHNLINAVCAGTGIADLAYDNALLFKNIALQSQSDLVRQMNATGDTTAAKMYQKWQQLRGRLTAELAKPLVERHGTDSLENWINRLEREMISVTSGTNKSSIPGWKDIQQALQYGEAAIEFIHYTLPRPMQDAGTTRYAALLLLPDGQPPRFIPLFDEKRLIELLEQHTGHAGAVASLYARSGKLLDEKKPGHGAELYKLIWKPVARWLPQSSHTLYVSLSGQLHRVNLAALPTGKNRVLAHRYTIRQLGSTRNILHSETIPTIQPGSTALLYGGIRYAYDSTAVAQPLLAYRDARKMYLKEGGGYRQDTTPAWEYLSGSEQEVWGLNRLLGNAGVYTTMLTKQSATEESVKVMGYYGKGGPDILHIATHGFFFPDQGGTAADAATFNCVGERTAVFKWNDNPLFRSGLIFAGANAAWTGQSIPPEREDGILTAYEISQLNLSNTKLAVLSACETGLGDIRDSEGVYGLQRAFKMAGVDYLLVSLWQVPDKETSEFMDLFYKKWLKNKNIYGAFATAQKKMRKKYEDVYHWAAWVLIK